MDNKSESDTMLMSKSSIEESDEENVAPVSPEGSDTGRIILQSSIEGFDKESFVPQERYEFISSTVGKENAAPIIKIFGPLHVGENSHTKNSVPQVKSPGNTNEESHISGVISRTKNNVTEAPTFALIKEHKERILSGEILEPQRECCIYRVPNDLRKIHEEAYTPQVVSIGPLHHGEKELSAMEIQKIRFVREFSKQITDQTWQEFINYIVRNEQRIRNCYAEMPIIKHLNFITMILYDAVFIIEYLLRMHQKDKSDILMENLRGVRYSIWIDLLLLENQLPYFVLKVLYEKALPDLSQSGKVYPSFFSLSFLFIYFDMFEIAPNDVDVKHFTDLRRHFITKVHHDEPKLRGAVRELPCVVKLQNSGMKFKPFKGSECFSESPEGSELFLDIKVQKRKQPMIPFWNSTELQIPHIAVFDETERLIRNLMGLEKCHYPDDTQVCNYINIMDRLINTEEDVNVLVEAGIISNYVGDTARIAKMFNELCLHISFSDSRYCDVVNDLNAHYRNPWNHAKATLKRVYFSDPWRATGTVAAAVLLLLTLIQTICSVISVV